MCKSEGKTCRSRLGLQLHPVQKNVEWQRVLGSGLEFCGKKRGIQGVIWPMRSTGPGELVKAQVHLSLGLFYVYDRRVGSLAQAWVTERSMAAQKGPQIKNPQPGTIVTIAIDVIAAQGLQELSTCVLAQMAWLGCKMQNTFPDQSLFDQVRASQDASMMCCNITVPPEFYVPQVSKFSTRPALVDLPILPPFWFPNTAAAPQRACDPGAHELDGMSNYPLQIFPGDTNSSGDL
ncbi:hypothetical protein FB45DRAFT_864713 [Roridomyces roridus]|uniref:Uncharacterized protein n=1 Tax=Roridomyces roridus TaxID=1738132 RepID=A0AAD7C1N2_9AGAR|nr:hypothetical protein FB45DRAFT_864713 [Roridomyces roridus]